MTINGCGGEGSPINPPELRFRAACNEHDEAYTAGGTPHDRAIADRAFLKATKAKAANAPWFKAAYLYPAAYLYFGAVRLGGWHYWAGKPGSPKP